MSNTLIAKISNLNQYDSKNKIVTWQDDSNVSWERTYSKIKLKDYAIFIAHEVLLIGNVTDIISNESIQCSNIEEVNCKNDQFLQLHEVYPELISRMKANFKPFVHPKEINLKK